MITPAHAFFNWVVLRKWFRPWWVVAGSVLPDASPFVAFFYLLAQKGFNPGNMGGFFGFVMANGNPNRQPGFMEMSFLLSSLPLYALVGVLVLYLRRKWLSSLWAGWGLHILADFLTHVSDAYAPLYPLLADWRPRGIVSYWEPEYGADIFWTVQLVAAGLIMIWLLGKRLWVWRRAPASHRRGVEARRSKRNETPGRDSR